MSGKNKKRFLAFMMAAVMLLSQSGFSVAAGETETATEQAVQTSELKASETQAPETKAPETKAPETQAPETQAPETKAPETQAPETKAPETQAPETKAPETQAPETKAPETQAPEMQATETQVSDTGASENNTVETTSDETDVPETQESAPAQDPESTDGTALENETLPAEGTEAQTQSTEEDENAMSTEGTEPESETEAESESETETEKPELKGSVSQEVIQVEEKGEGVFAYVKYTVTAVNLSEKAAAEDVTVAGLLSGNLTWQPDGADTAGMAVYSGAGQLPDREGISDADLGGYAASQAVSWTHQKFAPQEIKTYHFMAKVAEGITSASELSSSWYIGGKHVDAASTTWAGTEKLSVEKKEEEKPKTSFLYEDSRVRISAVAPKSAKLPQNSELKAVYMPQGSAGYEAAVGAIKSQMGDENTQFLDFVCYDVYFEADGVRIEPEAGSVRVKMTYKQPVLSAAESGVTEYATYHIDGETNVVEDVTGSINTNAAGEVTSVGFSTDGFSPIVTVTKVHLNVDVKDRKYYKDYGLAANKSGELGYDEENQKVSEWSTTIFRVTQYDENGVVVGTENQYAYCLQSFMGTPGSGDYTDNKLQAALNSCPELQRILYYGFGGPGDLSGRFFTAENLRQLGQELDLDENVVNEFVNHINEDNFRYILTHVVASKAYYSYNNLADSLYGDKSWYESPESVAYWGMNAGAIALANKWYEYLTSADRKQPGTITLNGNDYSYDQETVEQKEATSSNLFTFNGKADNSITFTVPEHLNCVVNGRTYTSGNTVEITGGQSFYFTPVSEYSETPGGVAAISWNSGTLNMSNATDSWQAVVLYDDQKQDIGAVSFAGDADVDLKLNITGSVGALKIVKTNEDGKPVAGAKFEVYKQKGGFACYTLTTGTDGTAYLEMRITEDIKNNTVYVKEVSAPDEYVVDSTLYTVQLTPAQSNPEPKQVNAVNKYKKAKLKIKKVDERGTAITLAGASFELYQGNTKIAELTTNADGVTQETDALRPGVYTVKEITAPDGYVLNTKEQSVTITAAQLGNGSTIPVIEVTFSDCAVKGKLKLTKKGEVLTNVTGPDGDKEFVYASAKLSGAEFALYAKEAIKAPYDQTTVLYKADALVRSGIKTDANGAAEVSDLPLGTYYLKETVAPDGFVLSDSKYEFTVSYKDQQTAVIEVAKEVGNARQKVSLSVIKKDSEKTKTLAGARFGLYAAQDIRVGGQVLLSKDSLIGTAITDTDGIAAFTQELPLGSYYAKELTAPVGYKRSDATVTFEVTGNGGTTEVLSLQKEFTDDSISVKVNKVELKDGAETPLADAELTLKAAEEIKGVDGSVLYQKGDRITSWISTGEKEAYDFGPYIVGGASYILEETVAPEGYVYASEIAFSVSEAGEVNVTSQNYNDGIIFVRDKLTRVEITKQFETNGEQVYELKGDEKVVFDILKVVDGKEEKVRSVTITADTNPCVVEGLPAGKYILREVSAPAGFMKAADREFTVSDKLTALDVVPITPVTVENKAIETSFSKITLAEHEELAGASLQVLDGEGNVAVTVYGERLEWTSDGSVKTVKGLAPGRYQLVETAAPAGYVVHGNIAFEVEKDGTVTVDGDTVDQVEMTDDTTKVTLSKKDITTGEELTGATLQVIDAEGRVVEEWTSGEKAHYLEAVLTAGEEYTLREIAAPDGYAFARDVKFTVGEDGVEQVVEMVDDITKVTISKQDMTTGKELTGARLILKDSKGEVVDDWITDGAPKEFRGKLIAGESYTLTEIYAPKGYDIADTVTFTVNKDGTVQKVVMKDEVADGKGSVNVQKLVKIDGKYAAVTYTFYAALFADEALTRRVSSVVPLEVKAAYSTTATFNNLEYGTYYVAETDELGNPISKGGVVTSNEVVNGRAVLTPQQATADTVIINHVDLPSGYYMDGRVTVNKKVLVNGKAGNVDDTFYFALFLDEARTMPADAGVHSVTLDNASEGTVVFENIPYGRYYLSETDENGVPVDDSYAYDVQISSEEVNLTEGSSEATITVTNCIEKVTESEAASKNQESKKNKAVKTGDDTPIAPFAAAFAVSALILAALVLILVRRRKRNA